MTASRTINRLRTTILVALLVGIAAFTGVMFTLVESLSEHFGPQVAADLEWRAQRGAQELSKTADLGLAVSDRAMVEESFGPYIGVRDIQAIVAVDTQGKLVAHHGEFAQIAHLFSMNAGTLVHGDGYVASWAPANIEGAPVGKIAVIVSTERLADARSLLGETREATLVAGLAAAVLGVLLVLFFTRAVSIRDHQLADHAKNLEAKVEARTRELDERNRGMRRVLDNVAQGFITIDLAGVVDGERSAIVDRWFGDIAPGTTFDVVIGRHAPDVAVWFRLGLAGVRDDVLPIELSLDQMPKRFDAGDRTYEVRYAPILDGGVVARILVIVSDITEHLVRERAEREQREMIVLVQHLTTDRSGFDQFFDEVAGLVASLQRASDPVVEKRTLHTLKGNCASYGFASYAALCHDIEDRLADTGGALEDIQRAQLAAAWSRIADQMRQLLGPARRDAVEVSTGDLARAIAQVEAGMPARDLAAMMTAWSHEPIARRFERLGHGAKDLAVRLDKGALAIRCTDGGIRLDPARWAPFWSAAAHAVRNAIDHGIEDHDTRLAAGKPIPPTLSFTAERTATELVIEIADDGAGIDWEAVRERARAAGLPFATHADLEQALFADGLSTREIASETSGRGVGMAALRVATTQLGGTISVDSAPRKGTTLRFHFDAIAELARAVA